MLGVWLESILHLAVLAIRFAGSAAAIPIAAIRDATQELPAAALPAAAHPTWVAARWSHLLQSDDSAMPLLRGRDDAGGLLRPPPNDCRMRQMRATVGKVRRRLELGRQAISLLR